ncbi:peptidoglycan D,D-transpeptidase FtsI family protein [Amycolatopsis sp. H20-H5]|uniref:peptidoglycan D,D-transpeptidase FtsI family protein n=1 Tax=Amycolatopsis sp. H20-H5 TaxID=3046309 RepID=UPI002DBF0805|nr:penicillin-binding transpeptidase domain-containing protein [Amycolatopsis sp. H20-H5]MEC3974537.1 penicillin-binding transpeptidase domain-containing protein [Amycolatopsis sp. H20-H5]
MNTPLRKVGVAMLVMVVLLLANATYIQVVKADDYRTDSRNTRVLYEEYARQRGQIVASTNGAVLAKVEPSNDKYKFKRTYVDGAMYAPVTGYYSINYGSAGLERAEDDILNGSDPRLFVRRLSDMVTGRDPRGGNVVLTIDPAVQKAAYDLMTQRGYTGSVVAMEPKTGRILAMVSTPSYDPNLLAAHTTKEQLTAWTASRDDPKNPMLNRAISETYPPGSTFKLVTASAALEAGMGPDTTVTNAPNVKLPGTQTTLENYGGAPCPGTTFKDALAHSCNVPFATFAGQLGKDKLTKAAQNFGIGQSDLTVPMRVAQSGLGPLDSQGALYQSGIGQRDVKLTPLQDCLLSATVANGGMAMKPQLVQSVLAPDLSTIENYSPAQLTGTAALSSANAAILRDMMVASEGFTGGGGKDGALQIASKTGTAEHGTDSKNTAPHAWYTGFAPSNDPQIAVSVIVESGGNRGLAATGGSVAAEIGRAAIKAKLGGG